jgi:hypothetical protein
MMFYLPILPLDSVVDMVALPRTSGTNTLQVYSGDVLPTAPCNVGVIRAGTLVTALSVSSRSGKTLSIAGPADGYADADLVSGDLVFTIPIASVQPNNDRDFGGRNVVLIGVWGGLIPVLDDVSAPLLMVYLGSDHLDTNGAPKLCRKDPAGRVNVIG